MASHIDPNRHLPPSPPSSPPPPSLSPEPSEATSDGTMRRSAPASSSAPRALSHPEMNPARALLFKVYVPLSQQEQPYVNIQALNDGLNGLFSFSLHKLDFKTGDYLDERGHVVRVEPHFRPVHPQDVETWLRESNPFDKARDFNTTNGYSRGLYAMTGAGFLLSNVDTLISGHDDRGTTNRSAMAVHTTWATSTMPRAKGLFQYHKERHAWSIEHIYRQSLNPEEYVWTQKANPGKPHAIITLSQDTPFKENVLCTSELTTLSYLLADVMGSTAQNPHIRYPVMVIAASCDTVRVTQAIWDLKTGRIQINMSRIVELSGYLWENNKQKYLTLLGWAMAHPGPKTW